MITMVPAGCNPDRGALGGPITLRARRLAALEASRSASSSPSQPVNTSSTMKHDTIPDHRGALALATTPQTPGQALTNCPTSDAPSSSTVVAARRDAPVYRPSHRGDISSALAASDTVESKAEALAEYEKEKYSQSSTRDSLLHTWQRLHYKWFGPSVPVFPVTVLTIAAVLSSLKKGGYRTPGNYISRIKSERSKYEPWHPWLEEEASAGIRSVCRGLGPAKQSLPYPLDRAAEEAHHRGSSGVGRTHWVREPCRHRLLLHVAGD